MKTIRIGKKKIGEGEPCFIVAEISCNHQQDKSIALKTISEAKSSGADAVKFQTYTPDTITIDSDKEYFKLKGTIWEGKTLYQLYQEAYTPWDWFPELFDRAKNEGLEFFSSPFDETAVDFLEGLSVPAYKIASFEINHIPLIKYAASKKKPVIISTGVATENDIQEALDAVHSQKNNEIILLKCTSAYPAPIDEANLSAIPELGKRYNAIAGLSDHTLSMTIPAYSVALGARLVEKHFTLEKKGPDKDFSLLPNEFSQMARHIREFETAFGKPDMRLTKKAEKSRSLMRSIFAVKDIKVGGVFTRDNIRVIRPGHGLHPKHFDSVLGKKAKMDIERGTPLEWGMMDKGA